MCSIPTGRWATLFFSEFKLTLKVKFYHWWFVLFNHTVYSRVIQHLWTENLGCFNKSSYSKLCRTSEGDLSAVYILWQLRPDSRAVSAFDSEQGGRFVLMWNQWTDTLCSHYSNTNWLFLGWWVSRKGSLLKHLWHFTKWLYYHISGKLNLNYEQT